VAIKEELRKRIERKQEEIREIEIRLREAQSYLAALQDMLKLIPRDQDEDPSQVLRPGSAVCRAREAIKKAGKPLHITEILIALGAETSKKNRVSLSGSLSGYAKRGEVFLRSAPNTFGLREFPPARMRANAEPPPGFGVVREDETLDSDLRSLDEVPG
jgi:hypothetical protein